MFRSMTRLLRQAAGAAYRGGTNGKGTVMSERVRSQSITQSSCGCGAMCADAPGHLLTPMRLRLATATPSGWRDAVVTAVHEDGRIELAGWLDATPSTVWQHADARDALAAGDVVALHAVYDVLAAGSLRLSVRP